MTTPKDPAPSTAKTRRPVSFAVETDGDAETASRASPAGTRAPRSFVEHVEIVPDDQDPFIAGVDDAAPPLALPRKRRFSFAKLAADVYNSGLRQGRIEVSQ